MYVCTFANPWMQITEQDYLSQYENHRECHSNKSELQCFEIVFLCDIEAKPIVCCVCVCECIHRERERE